MFEFLKRRKKEKVEEVQVKNGAGGLFVGLYCPVCGYMEVDEASNELPLEGFAQCANCGANLKHGVFLKNEDGSFSLRTEKKKVKVVSGGHYRVRKKGPVYSRHHDAVKKSRAVR